MAKNPTKSAGKKSLAAKSGGRSEKVHPKALIDDLLRQTREFWKQRPLPL
jgi:hypothetical protein